MIRQKAKIIIWILISILVISGCWDMVEIDKRLFVAILGVDTSDEEGKYTFYYCFPIAREIAGGEAGGGGGGQHPVGTAITVAHSIISGSENLALRLNRHLYFELMRTVVISEEVARKDLRKIIDPLSRDTEFNRRSRFAISQGDIKKVIEVTPWVEQLTSDYFESLYEDTGMTGKFIESDLGEFLRTINILNGNALVSKIKPDKTEVNIGGAAVIKDYRMVGWLDEEETQGVNMFLGRLKGGNIIVEDPDNYGVVTFSIISERSKLSLKAREPIPKFNLQVSIEGDVKGITHGTLISLEDSLEIQELVSKAVKEQILKGTTKIKDVYKVDLLKLGDHLRKYEPKLWEEYEENWDDMLPDIGIDVNVHTTIRNIGVIR
jgi:spore germination protein KC